MTEFGRTMDEDEKRWAMSAELRATMADLGWEHVPDAHPNPPLVWVHKDGWWSIESPSHPREENGCSYGISPGRIDTIKKLMGWLEHLMPKRWFTTRHAWQMVLMFEKLHPGSIDHP